MPIEKFITLQRYQRYKFTLRDFLLAEFNSIIFNSIAVRLLLNYLTRFAKPKFQKMTHSTSAQHHTQYPNIYINRQGAFYTWFKTYNLRQLPYRHRTRCSDSCNYSTVLYRLFQATVCVRGTVHRTAIFILSHQVTDNIYVNTVPAESSDRSPGGTCQDRQGREKELKQGFYESYFFV